MPKYTATFTEWHRKRGRIPLDDEGRYLEDPPEDGLERTRTGFFDEPSEISVVNALLYARRGEKSDWDIAYINEIEKVDD